MTSSPPRATGPSSLVVHYSTPALLVGSFANVHICVYRGDLTLEGLEAANRHHRALMDEYPQTLVLGSAQSNLSLPPAEVRQRGAQLIEENRAHVQASALVLEGTGFWASAVRSVTTAAFALARQPYPSKAFSTGLEAASWLLEFPGEVPLHAAAVADALAGLQQA